MEKVLCLVKYKDEFDEQIENLDQLMYWKIKFHPDLLRETVYLVIEEKKVLGVAYLVKRSGFLHIDKELAYHEIILEHYIPRGMIGDQKKLNGNGGESE